MPSATSPSTEADISDAVSMDDVDDFDPRGELVDIVRSLRAHLEWQAALGAHGVPRDPDAKQRVLSEFAAEAPRGLGSSSREAPRVRPPVARAPDASLPSGSPPLDERPAPPREAAVRASPSAKELPSRAPLPVVSGSLDELREMARSCTKCGLHEGRTHSVFSRGTGSSGLVFVGEAPGAEEDAQGLPFVGPAGQLLDKMIDAMGFTRDEVYVANIVKCRPPGNRKPDPVEMAACRPYLDAQLRALRPGFIVALGTTAVTGLFGPNEGIMRMRGRFRTFGVDCLVMPTFHPAYLLRVPSAKKDVWADLLQVVRAMGRTPKGK